MTTAGRGTANRTPSPLREMAGAGTPTTSKNITNTKANEFTPRASADQAARALSRRYALSLAIAAIIASELGLGGAP
jgi:hypothetical protein